MALRQRLEHGLEHWPILGAVPGTRHRVETFPTHQSQLFPANQLCPQPGAGSFPMAGARTQPRHLWFCGQRALPLAIAPAGTGMVIAHCRAFGGLYPTLVRVYLDITLNLKKSTGYAYYFSNIVKEIVWKDLIN